MLIAVFKKNSVKEAFLALAQQRNNILKGQPFTVI